METPNEHPQMDYPEHRRTYSGFLTGAMIAIVVVVVVLSAMAYFLV